MTIKRTTSFDVARAAGVSRSVVSAVINGTPGIGVSQETREKVLKAIKDLNYQVDAQARAMKTGLSRCIAAFGNMKNPLFLQVLEGMQKACAERGYNVLISGHSSTDEERHALLDLYRQRRIDGIVSLDETLYEDRKWLDAVNQSKVPYVSVEGYAGMGGVTSVLTDYRRSILEALDHMGGSEQRYPIYLESYLGTPSKNWAERDRIDAYRSWCIGKGVTPIIHQLQAHDEEWIFRFLQEASSSGERLPPMLINWSVSAVWFYKAAWKLGLRIGQELEMMAGDNTNRSNAYMAPPLSSVEIPYASMGEEATRLIFEQLDNKGYIPVKQWLQASIVPGDSANRHNGG